MNIPLYLMRNFQLNLITGIDSHCTVLQMQFPVASHAPTVRRCIAFLYAFQRKLVDQLLCKYLSIATCMCYFFNCNHFAFKSHLVWFLLPTHHCVHFSRNNVIYIDAKNFYTGAKYNMLTVDIEVKVLIGVD